MKNIHTYDNIFDFLLEHDQPVTSRKIEEFFQISGQEVRSVINSMRSIGYPIGSGNRGYHICRTAEELDKTIDNLNSRIAGITKAVDGLAIARRFLYGQQSVAG